MHNHESAERDSRRRLRLALYALFIAAGAASAIGRIAVVKSKEGHTPFLSANDRSRWSAVRALADRGEFFIDNAILKENLRGADRATLARLDCRARFDPRWNTIDKVRHIAPNGGMRYYSSKPVLLTAIVAAEYWLLKNVAGWDLEHHLFLSVRLLLAAINVLPLIAMWWLLADLVERRGKTTVARLIVVFAAVFGTYLTTYSVTFNNHLPAAASAMAAICCALGALSGRSWLAFFGAGFFAGLTAANELPALSLVALFAAALLWKAPLKTLLGYGGGAAIVAVSAWGLNYAVHGSWRPPYAHRSQGELVAEFAGPETALFTGARKPSGRLREAFARGGVNLTNQAQIEPAGTRGDWVLWDEQLVGEWALVRSEAGYEIFVRDNWYDYECSYWTTDKNGVDKGEPSRLAYAAHVLVGHHGLFSLTPLWLVSVGGCWLLVRDRAGRYGDLRAVAIAAAILTVVCLGFYIARPLEDRNYGGVASGLRWLFWLIPFWLICLLPAADGLARRKAGLAILIVCLGGGVFSAHYKPLNPWSHPWLFDVWTHYGGSVGGENASS